MGVDLQTFAPEERVRYSATKQSLFLWLFSWLGPSLVSFHISHVLKSNTTSEKTAEQ